MEELTVDGHLKVVRNYLSDIRVKWYDIGIELRVKVATLDSIRNKYSDDGDCLREMLKEWLKSISPTWTILTGALRSKVINEGKLAKHIEDRHTRGTAHTSTNIGHAPLASQRSASVSSGASKFSPISAASPGDSLPSYQATYEALPPVNSSSSSSPDSSPLGSDVENDLQQQLDLDSRKIQTQYAEYVDCIRKIVESKQVDLGELRSFLINLPACNSHDKKKPNLLSHMKDELQKAAKISDIFFSLSANCASFLDYDIFQTILEKYGSAVKLKYPFHLKEYIKKLKVREFVKCHPKLMNPKLKKLLNDLEKIHIKCNIQQTQNLSNIEEVRRAVANILGLKSSALHLCSVTDGCVILTLLISRSIAESVFTSDAIFTAQNIREFQEAKVMWLECYGYKFDFREKAYYTRSIEEDECFSKIIHRVPSTSLRYFGCIMLNFEPGKLEQLQLENDESIVTFIIKEWFKIPMTFTERWEQLDKTIFDLEREECALSKELHSSPQGSSDSAFSELDTFPSSSVSSGELALEEEGAQSYSLQFMDACRNGNIGEIQCCLQEGIIEPDEVLTALMHAAFNGDQNVVEVLIDHGAPINKQDEESGCTPMTVASEKSHLSIVSLLLSKGADPNIQESHGMCPLLIGAERNDINLVKLCLTSPITELDIANEEGKTALIFAVENNNFELVKFLLREEFMGRINVEHQEESRGWNAVMYAAFYGYVSFVDLLTDYGAEIDKQDNTGCTALVLASSERHLEVVSLLVKKGANPNIKKNDGLCPILIGAKRNDADLVKLICSSALTKMDIVDKESKTALILAAEKGNVDVVRVLLQEEFMERINVEHHDENGRAAIHVAIENGYVDIVRILLHAFPEARDLEDKNGNTPADIAERCDNTELVALFGGEIWEEVGEVSEKELGKNLSKEEGDEQEYDRKQVSGTVERGGEMQTTTLTRFFRSIEVKNLNLMRAAKAGNARKVEKLLKLGAQPDTIEIDTLQWTPLMWASQKNHVETVKVLLKYRADPNLTARNGYTALILASRQGNHVTVKLLLDSTNPIKTDVQIKNKTRGWSALMWACQSRGKQFDNEKARANRRIVAKYLLDAGADVNSKADNGWTPIMQASQDGDVEMVKILTSQSSLEIDHESANSWTALTTACRKEHFDIIKVLVEAGADVNKKKKGGVAPLHITTIKKMVEASKYLIEHGADVNIQDEEESMSPVTYKKERSNFMGKKSVLSMFGSWLLTFLWGITPLMLAVKENNSKKQDFQNMIEFITAVKADVNLQAEKYAKWTAIFFSIKNKDQKTSEFLFRNKARMDIKDERGHTPLSISKGLILDEKVKMYKFLVNLVFPPEDEEIKPDDPQSPATFQGQGCEFLAEEKDFSPADGAIYTAVDLRWRMTQLPTYLVNLPAF